MADTGIFATTAEVQRKAGANASSTSNVEAYINDFMTQAESLINAQTRTNWSDLYSGLNVDVKGILKMAASAWAAMKVINYDMSGFTSRVEAETMLDVLRDEFVNCMKTLEDMKVRQFIKDA
jgi:hypothetical protein|tara:strand:+ start:1076 stop:1441 length:366 start_codon:yes stop_codon:yes gene_type:complete